MEGVSLFFSCEESAYHPFTLQKLPALLLLVHPTSTRSVVISACFGAGSENDSVHGHPEGYYWDVIACCQWIQSKSRIWTTAIRCWFVQAPTGVLRLSSRHSDTRKAW
jgi:hypothetical protein